jgi:hypothetical protein
MNVFLAIRTAFGSFWIRTMLYLHLKPSKRLYISEGYLDYFEKTYIGSVVDPKAVRIVRKTPPFPIAIWSS